MGLFHPVEIGGIDEFTDQDPLGDTPTCVTEQQCIDTGIASNVMFPQPISATFAQQGLTANQSQVLNLQVLVD